MTGFFSESTLAQSKAPQARIPRCGACGLYKTCKSPKMQVAGKGKREILIVGEAPGEEEDKQGRPFVGVTGQLLERTLGSLGIQMRQDCWITNSLICRPPRNATPTWEQVKHCQPNILKLIEELKPKVIIPLGLAATYSIISLVSHEDVDKIGPWLGWNIPLQKYNCWICPTWHPSFVIRQRKREVDDPVAIMYWEDHLEKAVEHTERPWKVVPDYRKQVRRIYDGEEAAKEIKQFVKRNKLTAIDIEANMLKPDSSKAYIACCGLSDGTHTIAYPWVAPAMQATKVLLQSDVPKVASNMNYERRWFGKFLGTMGRNWDSDTVLQAHVADNRRGICSLKFQAFVRFGIDNYNSHLERMLHAKHANQPNRIREIDLGDLLLYCGMDNLLEVLVAKDLKKELHL